MSQDPGMQFNDAHLRGQVPVVCVDLLLMVIVILIALICCVDESRRFSIPWGSGTNAWKE